MNGQPRINAGFLVGHHEFYEDDRRRVLTAVKKRRMVAPAKTVPKRKKNRTGSAR